MQQAALQIAVSLLDPVKGHPIQTWTFGGTPLVRIGRGQTNDIVLTDPVVSRVHAELVSDSGRWRVVSLGRNGTFVDGEPVAESVLISHGGMMQLGSNGPCLEFCEGHRERRGGETILTWNASALAMPQMDEDHVRSEVGKIAEGDNFREIQKQAQELKRARAEDDTAKY